MSSASAIAGACCSSLARTSSCAPSAAFVGARTGTAAGVPSTSDVKFSGCSCANFHAVGSRSSSSSSSASASPSSGLSSWGKDFRRVSSSRRRSCQWDTDTFKDLRFPAGRGLAFLAAPRAAANAEKLETEPRAPVPAETEDVKFARRAADWKKAAKLKETGAVHRGRVDACNSGGLLVRIGTLQGFLPFSHLNAARIPRDGSKAINDIGNELVGDFVSVKVIEVVEADRRLIVSEKLAALVDIIQQIQEGTVYKGKVNFVTDYGAFVDLQFPDGSYPVSGLVHVTELSWDPIPFPQDFIAQGQEVSVKVIQVDREKSKIALSIKQLQADPLLETLDTLMPTQDDNYSTEKINSDVEVVGTPLPGLEQICSFMLQEEGISDVTLGRQALERRVVSQDLELWLSNAIVEDGKFTLLARAGRQVQEVYLNTTLDREGIKAAVQRVTGRVP